MSTRDSVAGLHDGEIGRASPASPSSPAGRTDTPPGRTGSPPDQTGSSPDQTGSPRDQTALPPDQASAPPDQAGAKPSASRPPAPRSLGEVNRAVVERFRAGGEIPGMHRDRLLLLTTIGARSGQRRTAPMMFHRDANRLLVIASNAGAADHPAWYRNVLAQPRVMVEIDDESYGATARSLEGEERELAWRQITDLYPFFAEHQARAGRVIPVVALERTSDTLPAVPD